MFKGLSTLRKQERKAAVDTEETKKLQAYLSKYTSAAGTSPNMFLFSGSVHLWTSADAQRNISLRRDWNSRAMHCVEGLLSSINGRA